MALKRAFALNRDPDGGVAVVVAGRPCVVDAPLSFDRHPIEVTDRCNDCGICLDQFGCPALSKEGDHVVVDPNVCGSCGNCVNACARGAIVPQQGGES
jgi:indolepyruvate ferredoxin oxidoreductase alpha subunit